MRGIQDEELIIPIGKYLAKTYRPANLPSDVEDSFLATFIDRNFLSGIVAAAHAKFNAGTSTPNQITLTDQNKTITLQKT